jgi:hypothetical protein
VSAFGQKQTLAAAVFRSDLMKNRNRNGLPRVVTKVTG